jgi:preprotein translocase SecE subunit
MFFSNDRVYTYSIVGIAAVIAFVLWKLLTSIVGFMPVASLGPIPLNYLAVIIALGSVGAAGYFCWKNEKVHQFGIEVIVETKKVSWPSFNELKGSTLVVLVMVLISTAIIWGLDKAFDTLIGFVY